QPFLGSAKAGTPGIADLALAVPLEHVDNALARARDLDEGIGEPLLLGVEHLLGFLAALEHERAIALDTEPLGEAGRSVRILHALRQLALRRRAALRGPLLCP